MLFIVEAIGLALNDSNRVVKSLYTSERDFAIGLAVRSDAVPMTFDYLSELVARFEPLLPDVVLPVVEEFPAPNLVR